MSRTVKELFFSDGHCQSLQKRDSKELTAIGKTDISSL